MITEAMRAELMARLQLRPVMQPPSQWDVVYTTSSADGVAKVVRRLDSMDRVMLTYHTCDIYTHSVLYPNEPTRDLQGAMYLIPALLEPPANVLLLGSAAGGCLRQLELVYPAARVVGVDIDERAHRVAREVFQVNTRQCTLVTADAREYLRGCAEKFDVIIVDLFAGTSPPPHCLTREFFALVCEHLTEDGGMFLNIDMEDVPFEIPEAKEPVRAIRHVHSTLMESGFKSLFENAYFNSVTAFKRELSEPEVRRILLERAEDAASMLSLRAAAGLAAYTTLEVRADPERYPSFSDDWFPEFSPRASRASIYLALQEAGVEEGFPFIGSNGGSVPQRVLRTRFEEWRDSGEPALRNLDALVTSLNEVEEPLGPDALSIASRYFRFRSRLPEVKSPARSAWAELALLYARLYTAGQCNDHESMLLVLQAFERFSRKQGSDFDNNDEGAREGVDRRRK